MFSSVPCTFACLVVGCHIRDASIFRTAQENCRDPECHPKELPGTGLGRLNSRAVPAAGDGCFHGWPLASRLLDASRATCQGDRGGNIDRTVKKFVQPVLEDRVAFAPTAWKSDTCSQPCQ